MASYHEQTSYSFHGGVGRWYGFAITAFETIIPGSKAAVLVKAEVVVLSSEEQEDLRTITTTTTTTTTATTNDKSSEDA